MALWYAKSVEGVYLLAQYVWGLMCYHGHNDVMPEYGEAFKWLLASALIILQNKGIKPQAAYPDYE